MAVGMVGTYVARIYEEAKRRPLYVITDIKNGSAFVADPPRGVILRPSEPLATVETSVETILIGK